MPVQEITLNLPDTVYEQIRRAAEKAQRPVNDLLVEAVTAVASAMNAAPTSLRSALAQMAYLTEARAFFAPKTS
jgi:hypothetical protein